MILFYMHSLRQDEVAAMSGPDEFGEFYHQLRQIKDHHRKNPNEIEEPMQMEFLRMESERQKPSEDMQSGLTVVLNKDNYPVEYYLGIMITSDIIDFSDDEGYGKFLDLHEVFDMFINLKQMEVCRAKLANQD